MKGRVVFIDHNVTDKANQAFFRCGPQFHQLAVKGRFDHVADLTLGLGNEDLERHGWDSIAAFLLEKKIAYLRPVPVSYNDPVIPGKAGDLPDGHP